MKRRRFIDQYKFLLRAITPFIWIEAPVPHEALDELARLAPPGFVSAFWRDGVGVLCPMCPLDQYTHTVEFLEEGIAHLELCSREKKMPFCLLLANVHLSVVDRREIILKAIQAGGVLVGIATDTKIPDELKPFVTLLRFPLPDREDYENALSEYFRNGIHIPDKADYESILKTADGLWLTEFTQLIRESISHFGKLSASFLAIRKKALLLQKQIIDNPSEKLWSELHEIEEKIHAGLALS